MKRRRQPGPRLDVVDVLQVRRAARMAAAPTMDQALRDARLDTLEQMADGFGFESAVALVAEADEVYEARGMGPPLPNGGPQ